MPSPPNNATVIPMILPLRLAFTQPQPQPAPDVTLTWPGHDTPSLRLLTPEWITATDADLQRLAQDVAPWTGPFHCLPGDWQPADDSSWAGTHRRDGVLTFRVTLQPGPSYVDLRLEVTNLSASPLEDLRADFCLGVNAGGGGWANRAFLPNSHLDRVEDGRYWHDRVAPPGAWIRPSGPWVQLAEGAHATLPLQSALLAMENQAHTSWAYLMFDNPSLPPGTTTPTPVCTCAHCSTLPWPPRLPPLSAAAWAWRTSGASTTS